MKTVALLAGIVFGIIVSARSEEPVYPVKVSPSGRYFVDQRGKPVFWLGTTQWQLFRDYSLDVLRRFADDARQAKHGVSPV